MLPIHVAQYLERSPASEHSPHADEVAGTAELSREHGDARAKRLFDSVVRAHPERAFFIGRACERHGQPDLAARYFEVASHQRPAAAFALLHLACLAEHRANHSFVRFDPHNRSAKDLLEAATSAAASQGFVLPAAAVLRFQISADRSVHAHSGVGLHQRQQGAHRRVPLRHHDAVAFNSALESFPAALQADPLPVLAEIRVMLEDAGLHIAKHREGLHRYVVTPVIALISQDGAETRTEAPWLLADRALGIARLLATLPGESAAAEALGNAVARHLPDRFAAEPMARLRALLTTNA